MDPHDGFDRLRVRGDRRIVHHARFDPGEADSLVGTVSDRSPAACRPAPPEYPVLLAVDQPLGEGASRGQIAEACREQLEPIPLVRVSHRRVGGLWWRGWSDDCCHQHWDRHHHRRDNRCARDHLLHPERIASVAARTGPRLPPLGCLGCSRTLPMRSARSKSGASGRGEARRGEPARGRPGAC